MNRFFLLFFFYLIAFSVSGQYKHLLHKTYAQRFLALDTVFYNNKVASYDSTEFFKKTDAIKKLAIAENDYELELEAELLRNEYYMIGYDYNHKLFVPRMKSLKKIADEQGIKHLQIRIRQKLGYYYFYKVQQYGPGFENYLGAYALMKNMPVSELPDKQEMLASIGTAYYIFGESKIARKILAEAQKVAPSYKRRVAINNTNTIGLLFRLEGKYDSADYYFRKAYDLAKTDNDSVWMGITSGNIGINYYQQGKHKEAVSFLEFDIEQSLKGKEVDNAINSSIVLAKVFMMNKEYKKAEELTRKALSYLYLTGDPKKHKVELYHLLAQQYKESGDLITAFSFLDSSRILHAEVLDRRSAQIHERAEDKVEIEKYKAAVLQEQHDKKVRNFQVQAVAGILILLSIIIILLINRNRVRLKKSQQKLKLEKESIETELDIAERQLLEFTEKIREKNQLIDQYSSFGTTENAGVNHGGITTERSQTMEQIMQSPLLTDEQWDSFLQLFDKVHKGYTTRLREKLPQISPADTRYILLTKLNLTPREMAGLLGVRPDAIRVYRHRLRKKLDIGIDESLKDLINNI